LLYWLEVHTHIKIDFDSEDLVFLSWGVAVVIPCIKSGC